ncbi:zinc finger domain-containing, c2h2-type [Trichoderma arundinaceum]|uniref:Zinc finger domain-containing, c2h2-type n=1 Tax=Trichoderma arundinaceum TaxID=490622 RepID=A0A395N8J2_TRIAR|nr:zinc finger domain-containing, c2h2-type [Trichoderma arundinaceum]
MASLAEQPFNLFPQQQDEFVHFAEASHGAVYSSAPMDLSIAADAYVPFVQRAPSQELYTSPSTIGYEPSLYTADAAPGYLINAPTSPGMYGDDYLPSSGLSTASAPSAPSSAVGSPLSNHGQIGIDWTVQGLGIQPGIANNDFVEFSAFGAHGLDDMAAFEFASLAHTKSFVGEF